MMEIAIINALTPSSDQILSGEFLAELARGLKHLQNQCHTRSSGFMPDANLSLRVLSYCIRANPENDNGGESQIGRSKRLWCLCLHDLDEKFGRPVKTIGVVHVSLIV